MFDHTSRYYELDTATLITPDGRHLSYKRRRFLPQAETLSIALEMQVKEGDRLDTLAANLLGDPEQYWQLCDANNAMNPFDLTAEIGRTLRIAQGQF
jgi:hypothetical protein